MWLWEAPFWNVLVLYGLCPNSFRPPSVKQANVGKKSAQTILASPPLCFRIGGAEDNFIFYIEYCFFFVPVMKLRWEYNILKHFGSISCEMFDYGHIFPQKTLWFGEKMAFLSQKSWFHAISWLFSFPTILICKIWTKYNFTATAEFRRTRFSCSNSPKHAQNWPFWAFSHFFFFWCPFFGNFEPQICFFIHQMWDKIP